MDEVDLDLEARELDGESEEPSLLVLLRILGVDRSGAVSCIAFNTNY
jgi:hypothetical protein